MKKTLSIVMIAIAASISTMMWAGTPINSSELPKAATQFLTKHFPGENVRKAEKEQGRRGMEYEVDLTSGAELEFNEDGSWKEVKAAHGKTVPAAIVPAGIAKYVAANYKGLSIIEIARKRGGYEVELSDKTELHLTAEGTPMQPRKGGNRPRH